MTTREIFALLLEHWFDPTGHPLPPEDVCPGWIASNTLKGITGRFAGLQASLEREAILASKRVPKRLVGRPRVRPLPDPNTPKRGPGRPRTKPTQAEIDAHLDERAARVARWLKVRNPETDPFSPPEDFK